MEQLNFFESPGNGADLPADLMIYKPAVFDQEESEALLEAFIHQIQWIQETVHMYGKMIKTPRLTAWYGDNDKAYSYSGNKYHPLPWTDDLLKIKTRIEPFAGTKFNSVLLNYYRDGNDSVAWHSDDEYELGFKPVIASVSFGQARRFDVRNKQDHKLKYAVTLENGSLLLMKGDLQQFWQHRIAKSTQPMEARVNLTFRVIV
ncbi:MAG TPA: alpha-ketoglutarate-dependent dioxygenase AlkB [Mucilaginibacter sp.]|jgi:alkylated DNA repair dioxygenase AlkB|nr:alpha-ketoglutarate-dependent dioxygenase AlkB [Mucilaginibacter sp.]